MNSNYEELRDYYDNTDLSDLIENAEEIEVPDRHGSEAMSAFTVRLPTHVLQAVRDLASRNGVSTGAAMRTIIEEGVAETVSDDAVVSVAELRRLISTARRSEAG